MANKAGMGRLTFSGRQEYQVVRLFRHGQPNVFAGYAAVCPCELGAHYLDYDESGALVERTADRGSGNPYLFATAANAQAAIEQWQRQHDAAQAASGESEL